MTTIASDPVDLVGEAAVRDPQTTFERLRRLGPVVWLTRHKSWLVLDHDLVRKALVDARLTTDTITPLYERLSSDERLRFRDAEELLRGWMIFNDPPVHTMLRDPVRTAFTPRAVAMLRDDIAGVTDELLAPLEGSVDFVREVAFPLPAIVIAVLLGVDPSHYQLMGEWSKQLGALVMGKVSRTDAWDRALQAAQQMQEYFGDLVQRYRASPADNLISRMVSVSADESAAQLTHEQLVGACSLLLFGGHETTTSLLSTGVYRLIEHADARRRLVAEPSLAASAVEELLRYDGPSKVIVRRVRESGDWEGVPFEAGQPVFCGMMAANHDPAVFTDADKLVIDREPNRHVGFGWGLHYCLGAQLARLEAQVVIPKVVERFPELELDCAVADLRWHPTIVGRTLRALPVSLGPPGSS